MICYHFTFSSPSDFFKLSFFHFCTFCYTEVSWSIYCDFVILISAVCRGDTRLVNILLRNGKSAEFDIHFSWSSVTITPVNSTPMADIVIDVKWQASYLLGHIIIHLSEGNSHGRYCHRCVKWQDFIYTVTLLCGVVTSPSFQFSFPGK